MANLSTRTLAVAVAVLCLVLSTVSESKTLSINNLDRRRLQNDTESIPKLCSQELDLAILMDSSGSISNRAWKRMKIFVKNIINQYKIGPQSVHVALIQMSTKSKVVLKLNSLTGDNLSSKYVKLYVEKMVHRKGMAFLDRSLHAADQIVFTEANGMRPTATKVALLITDGRQPKRYGPYTPLHLLAQSLRSKGVQLYTVGVGRAVDKRELEMITMAPQNVFLVKNFKRVLKKAEFVGHKICASLPKKCNKELDLAFLVDSSSSINKKWFGVMKSFLKEIINRYVVGPDSTHVSVVSFSTFPNIELTFNSLSGGEWTQTSVNSFINKMPHRGGLTFIDRVLQTADHEVFTEENGMRPEATKVAILITDGPQTKRFDPFQPLDIPSMALRNKGVQLYAVGVGPAVSRQELETITSASQNVFLVRSFYELAKHVNGIGYKFC